MPLEPGLELERVQVAPEGDLVLAQRHVDAPAAEARLHYHGAGPRWGRPVGVQHLRPGMRQPFPPQDARRQQLVVDGEERARAVEDANASRGERAERPEAVFDAVQRVGDVEPADRSVGAVEQDRCAPGREDARVDPARRSRRQGDVGRGPAPGDEGEQHDFFFAEESANRKSPPQPVPAPSQDRNKLEIWGNLMRYAVRAKAGAAC